MRLAVIAPVVGLFLLSGCAGHKGLYYWGNYEAVLLDMYVNPGEAPAEVQIEKLTASIEQAQNNNLKVPPGLFAHLGMMYAKDGSPALAVEAFKEEKARYPESATFIDGLLARAQKEVKQ